MGSSHILLVFTRSHALHGNAAMEALPRDRKAIFIAVIFTAVLDRF